MDGPLPELRLAGGALTLTAAFCRLRRDGAMVELTGRSWRRRGAELEVDAGPVRFTVRTRARRGLQELTVLASASEPVEVDALGLAFEANLDGATPAWLLYDGYQSWDQAGITALGDGSRTAQSYWRCAVAGDSGAGVALAAGAARRHVTRFDFAAGELRWLQVAAPAGGASHPVWRSHESAEFRSEPLRVRGGADVRAAARACLPRLARTEGPAPHGWLSWYHNGIWVDADGVLANARLLPEGAGAVIQIDDGWQQAYGDWVPNTKFPDLAGFCEDLEARDQVPGIWTAPFLVSAGSDLAGSAPESWFLRDAGGGRLVDPRHTVFGPMYVLDPRRPAVRRHLTDVFRRLRGAGFRHFKIDFLYAGAYAGLEAFRAGLTAIRRGAGADAYLLACGAPLLPVAGVADGCRIGPDTCTPWLDLTTGEPLPTFFGDEVLNVVRNVAWRSDLSPWFQTDPDVAVTGGTLTAAKARQLMTAVALCGGLYFLSDDLRVLAADRREIALRPELRDIAAGGAATPDWEPNGRDLPPSIWRRGGELAAVINHGSVMVTREIDVPAGSVARDVWSGESLAATGGRLKLDVEPEGVRLIRFAGR